MTSGSEFSSPDKSNGNIDKTSSDNSSSSALDLSFKKKEEEITDV